ncbi:MAG TPA: preprotein translocase subunit SecA [Rhabdochlamydiaceae bacterium]|nr:preprotein translocase subunit SecA [Rhabdochlamydiaceae bacterium]
MFDLLKQLFGTQQTRLIKKYQKIVRQVNLEEQKLAALTDEQVKAKTGQFRERLVKGETLDDILPEAYAVVKAVCRRICGTEVQVSGYTQKWDMIPYDVQILGAIALHKGSIAEMMTGEGKTLTAAMPLYLNALTGKPVHLVTVNDYLAQRDCEWNGPIFRWLGLRTEALTNATPHFKRRDVYGADVVYGTASEFGFDYLRDNSMAQSAEDQCQRGHYFVIIDEVDSILIDEARTPLIISGPSSGSKQMYDQLQEPVAQMVRFQRDLCNKYANEARKILENLGRFAEGELKKLSKAEEAEVKEGFRKLWIVSKGMPHNKVLKRVKEDPNLRAEIDAWDVYYYGETNKEERGQALSELYIIVDERANEYELTDKGIKLWGEMGGDTNDFIMFDLGHEYAQIDQSEALDQAGKMQKKVELREADAMRKERAHNLRQLLRAHLLMEKDVDYIVAEGKIVIIDEHTGRPQPGRRFSDGLHQAIEAKENVAIQGETQTYATITLQNYFRLHEKIAGMTGTAMTEANEFREIYKLEVLAIPTHRKNQRKDFDDEVYMTEREKYHAILKEIEEVHKQGRPILIGTESVDVSEKLSRILKQNKLEHTVLNAKNHAKEAEIIALAGRRGSITVATNMAGRGTDIKLEAGVAELGGLEVIGTTRHQSRRIDRQLRGRCARQGDPGSSKFYVSFEDSLLRLFTSPRITSFLQRFRPPENEPISAKVLNKSIETAQKRVEQRNYQTRKHTLEYDDVMNKQRSEIYAFRNEVLRSPTPFKVAEEVLESLCLQMAQTFFVSRSTEGGWNPEGYRQWLMLHFPVTFDAQEFDNDYLQLTDIENAAMDKVVASFRQKIAHEREVIEAVERGAPAGAEPLDADGILTEVVRSVLIRSVDRLWQEHLLHIDHLRTEVHLRVVGQKDPLLEFKHEAFLLFDAFSANLKTEIAHALFKFKMMAPSETPPTEEKPRQITLEHEDAFRTNLSLMPELEFIKES